MATKQGGAKAKPKATAVSEKPAKASKPAADTPAPVAKAEGPKGSAPSRAYDPKTAEKHVVDFWVKNKIYDKLKARNAGGKTEAVARSIQA